MMLPESVSQFIAFSPKVYDMHFQIFFKFSDFVHRFVKL